MELLISPNMRCDQIHRPTRNKLNLKTNKGRDLTFRYFKLPAMTTQSCNYILWFDYTLITNLMH